jgi:hypothetical protein
MPHLKFSQWAQDISRTAPIAILVELADLQEKLVFGRIQVGAELGNLVCQGLGAFVVTRGCLFEWGDGAHGFALGLNDQKFSTK